MDTLVSSYSQSAFEDEGYSSDEHQELVQYTPPLSLKFSLPPIANVQSSSCNLRMNDTDTRIALIIPPRLD